MMKFDMHCHTKEGSLDAKLDIISYARLLKAQGYNGMLTTDHNSFGGYRAWAAYKTKPEDLKDFIVLKGIEYDTRDGGHVIVVLPDGTNMSILEKRGLTLDVLEKLVHLKGGIIGAAHPYGYGYFAIMNTKLAKRNRNVIKKFDFIETYNSGIPMINNAKAKKLAEEFNLPQIGGSDAHSALRVGTAYTTFNEDIRCNNDLIDLINSKSPQTLVVGKWYKKLLKKRKWLVKELGIISYWIYNKIGMVAYTPARHKVLKHDKSHDKYISV